MTIDERTNRAFIIVDLGPIDSRGTPHGPGHVVVLDGTTGQVVRTVAVGITPSAVALDAGTNRVFIANGGYSAGNAYQPGTVSVLDAATGVLRRAVAADPKGVSLSVDTRRHRVYLPGGDVLDATTGARVRFPFPGGCSAVDARAGRLIVSTQNGEGVDANMLRVLDVTTGHVVHSEAVLSPQSCPLAVDEAASRALLLDAPAHDAYVSHLRLLDTRGGRTLATRMVGGTGSAIANAGAADKRRGHFLAATLGDVGPSGCQLDVLDARTGRALRAVALSRGPAALAVDERTRRVFALNTADHTLSVFDAARL